MVGGVTVSMGLIRGDAFCISLTRKALCKIVHYSALQCSEVPFSAVQWSDDLAGEAADPTMAGQNMRQCFFSLQGN